jgi:hypothetical protein
MFGMRWMMVACLLAEVVAGTRLAICQGFTPDKAAAKMTVPDGFQVELVAGEPLVRQPVCIEFDDRGRLWVIQYLQYPNPEDLTRVRVDRYSRTEYERVPKPPPQGPRGADRITILEDTDGDGRMDRGRDFINGLNLASGIAFGHGGVYVLNVPYLLFYPDRDRDDVPDGQPRVLLEGFGMQDAHSVANSLTWGPDGWLYGCQGSTVTANIRGIEFQQGVWRYHPPTDAFELFCEGGGNSWGLDFDRVGNLLYSTNYGGYVLLHGVQGGQWYVRRARQELVRRQDKSTIERLGQMTRDAADNLQAVEALWSLFSLGGFDESFVISTTMIPICRCSGGGRSSVMPSTGERRCCVDSSAQLCGIRNSVVRSCYRD